MPTKPAPLGEYFDARVQKSSGCWHWTGSISDQGYGIANLPGGKRDKAHRVSYRLHVGEIPEGMALDHDCHNKDTHCAGGNECFHRRCVNPSHLEVSTKGDNTRRGMTPTAVNIRKTKCPRNHAYSRKRNRRGWRECGQCRSEAAKNKRRAATRG